jgi:hypothetical protein
MGISNGMTATKKLTLNEWVRLSQWPVPQDDGPAMDDLAGMRELLGALLKRYKRLLFESSIVMYPDRVPYIESVVLSAKLLFFRR